MHLLDRQLSVDSIFWNCLHSIPAKKVNLFSVTHYFHQEVELMLLVFGA